MTHGCSAFNLNTLEQQFPHLAALDTADSALSASTDLHLRVLDREGDALGLLIYRPEGFCASLRVDLARRTFQVLDIFESFDAANGLASLATLGM
jgi:hypothetical protein